MMGVSRQAYWKWLKRSASDREAFNHMLEEKIKVLDSENRHTFGSRQLAFNLNLVG